MSGWIKLHRDINNHWIWSNSDYFKWWVDILIEANYSPSKLVIKNKVYDCNRGEKLYSLDTWAKRWNTNKSKARRFLELLQKDNMIVLKSETQTTRLTVCNYDSYQELFSDSETQMKRKRNANETHLTPIKESKENKENKEDNYNPINWAELIKFFNKETGKKTKIISLKARTQFLARLKEGYTKEDITKAIKNVSKDSYHIETKLKYVTLEFISRSDKLDKFSQIEIENTKKSNQITQVYDN